MAALDARHIHETGRAAQERTAGGGGNRGGAPKRW